MDPSLDNCSMRLCCCCTRVANTARCFGGRCTVGPHWGCNLAAWAMILGITAAFNIYCAARLHYGVVIGNVLTCACLVAAFGMTTLMDPGYVTPQTPAQLERQKAAEAEAPASSFQHTDGATGVVMADPAPMLQYTACPVCNVLRSQGTQHCYDCGLCVLELDHHCPWSGHCIGKGNLQPFRHFLGFLLVHCVFTGVVSGWLARRVTCTLPAHSHSPTLTHNSPLPSHLTACQAFFVWLVTKGVGAATS